MESANSSFCSSQTGTLDLAVDGRYDHPGYCGSHCTVDFACSRTKLLVHIENLHKSECGKKLLLRRTRTIDDSLGGVSNAMERVGIERGLVSMQKSGLQV